MRTNKNTKRRKPRVVWYWVCYWYNPHSATEECGAESHLGWTAREDAEDSAARHGAKHGHQGNVKVYSEPMTNHRERSK
jgi:hypothetical protein